MTDRHFWTDPYAFELGAAITHVRGRVAALTAANLPIRSEFSDRSAGRRYWKVEGIARVSCGGTHLRRTGEVGSLSLKRRNIGKGKGRIEIRLEA